MKLGTLSNKVQSKIHLCSDTQRGHLYVFFMHQYTTLIIIQLWPHTDEIYVYCTKILGYIELKLGKPSSFEIHILSFSKYGTFNLVNLN